MTVLAPSKPRISTAPHAYVVPVVRELPPRRADAGAAFGW
jgi:hypothetical protein